jgi:hypothetical protein
MRQPANDEIEVTVIGPSYGECVVVHLGDGRWIIVDSTVVQGSEEPAPLEYLASLGVNPRNSVDLVVVTHWHDDHIRGICRTVETCSSADICVPGAFRSEEFLRFLNAHADPLASVFGTGVDEITAVFREMRMRNKVHLASEDKKILTMPIGCTAQGQKVVITALSPSSFQIMESLGKIGALVPGVGKTKRRAVSTESNDHSIALWISFGNEHVLLGADLETTIDDRAGWAAIVQSRNRPQAKAALFKVPHHGSETGHSNLVWTDLLEPDPHAIVTPWNRSGKLPKESDMVRLKNLTRNVHLTALPSSRSRVKHDSEIERLLRDFKIRTYRDTSVLNLTDATCFL